MPGPKSGGSDAGGGVDRENIAEDPSDYNQRRRLQSINDSRQTVLNWMREMDANENSPGFNEAEAATAFHGAVKGFLVDIESLLRSEGGDDVWSRELGEVTLNPPSQYQILGDSGRTYSLDDVRIIGDKSPKPLTLSVSGIFTKGEEDDVGFLDLPTTLREDWTVPARIRHKGQETLYGENDTHIPRYVSEAAFRLGNEFLGEHGLDVRLDEGRPFTDYS